MTRAINASVSFDREVGHNDNLAAQSKLQREVVLIRK